MRIAVYHNLPSGGGKRALFEMVKQLSEKHQIDVYTLSTAEHAFCDLGPFCQNYFVIPFQPLSFVRSPFGRLNQGIRSLDLWRLEKIQQQLANWIDRGQYDVVFVHHCQFSQSPGLLKFLHTRSVYYCQEPPRILYEPPIERPYQYVSNMQKAVNFFDPLPSIYGTRLRHLDKLNVEKAGIVLVNSHYSREIFYRTYGVFAFVCYLGVDSEQFKLLPVTKKHQILSVGALTPHKGFDLIIRGLGRIKTDLRPTLVIISNYTNPTEQYFLQNLADQFSVSIQFHNQVSDATLVQNYNFSLVTVYTPIMEPFGFVPLESMACTTPVIGIQEAGIRETIIHEMNGLLTEREPVALAWAIERLLFNEAERKLYGKQGREIVQEDWTWEKTSIRLEKFLGNG